MTIRLETNAPAANSTYQTLFATPGSLGSTLFSSELTAALQATPQQNGVQAANVAVSIGPASNADSVSKMTSSAYWAKQPAAVQQLWTMGDQGQRAAMASQLASEGYTIDVPVMVWGYDPAITTELRQQAGYTWVPSAMMQPVEMAPGLSMPGNLTPYDPNNPPVGAILVHNNVTS